MPPFQLTSQNPRKFTSSMRRLLGYRKLQWAVVVRSFELSRRRTHLKSEFEASVKLQCIGTGLCAVLWCNWPSNACFEACRPWIEKHPLYFQGACPSGGSKVYSLSALLHLQQLFEVRNGSLVISFADFSRDIFLQLLWLFSFCQFINFLLL